MNLRAQLTTYSKRYQEFQNAIEQSKQMVASCQTEIEKMTKRIKMLEEERNNYRNEWNIAEQKQRKVNEDVCNKIHFEFVCNSFYFV